MTDPINTVHQQANHIDHNIDELNVDINLNTDSVNATSTTDDLIVDSGIDSLPSNILSPTNNPTIQFNNDTLQYISNVNDNNQNDTDSDDDDNDNDLDNNDESEPIQPTDLIPIDDDTNDPLPVVDVSETLPVFASDYNKQLNTQINNKRNKLNKLIESNTDLTDRIHVIQQHIKHIINEEKYTQLLLSNKVNDIDGEKHLIQLNQRTLESYQHELSYLHDQCRTVQHSIQSIESNIYQTNQQIEQCKQVIQNKQGELIQWNMIEKQKLTDITQLQSFTADNNSTLKLLHSRSESLTQSLNDKKSQLHELELQTKLVQIELNTCAAEYQQTHTDKNLLIENYNRTVQQMHNIELNINSAQQTNNDKSLRIVGLKNRITVRQDELNQSINANKRIQYSIAQSESTLHRSKQSYSESQQNNRAVTNDIQFVKYTQRQLKRQLKSMKQSVLTLEQQCTIERERCNKLLNDQHSKQLELRQQQNNATDKSQVKDNQNELYEHSVNELKQCNKSVDTIKSKLIVVQQQLYTSKHNEQLLINEIQSIESMLKSCQQQKQHIQIQINKQSEILYNIAYTLNTQKSKLSHGTTEVSHEHKIRLDNKIKSLQSQLQHEQTTLHLLQHNYKKLMTSHTQYQKKLGEINKNNVSVDESMCEINLICNNIVINNNQLIQTKNSLLLIYNNLKQSIVKQRDVLYQNKIQYNTCNEDTVQLNTQYKQRLVDIQSYLDIQNNKIKLSTSNKSELVIELQQRRNKISKLKLKYESLAIKLAKQFNTYNNDDTFNTCNTEKNQAYYIIQVAQQRESLQSQCDAVQQQINVAESELAALHNTAQLIGSRNQQYKLDQSISNSNSVEAQEKYKLEQSLRECLDSLYKNKSYHRELQSQLNERNEQIQYITTQVQQYQSTIQQLDSQVQGLYKSISDQQSSVQRATTQYNARLHKLKPSVTDDQYNHLQQYKVIQSRRSRYKLIVNMLRDYIESKPELLQYQFNTSELIDIIRPLTASTTQSSASRPVTSRSIHSSASTSNNNSATVLPPIHNGYTSRPSSNKSAASNTSQLRMSVNTLRIG